MKTFKYYCHVSPVLWAACMVFATLPSCVGNDARGKCFLKAMKFNSSSSLMRFELLCFTLGNHGESGESFRRLQEFNLQSHMRDTFSLKSEEKSVCVQTEQSLFPGLCGKALCLKVLPTLYTCVFWSVSVIQC